MFSTRSGFNRTLSIHMHLLIKSLLIISFLGGAPIGRNDIGNSFAKHFKDKIKSNADKANVDPNGIYNGKRMLIVQNRNFMKKHDIIERLNALTNTID